MLRSPALRGNQTQSDCSAGHAIAAPTTMDETQFLQRSKEEFIRFQRYKHGAAIVALDIGVNNSGSDDIENNSKRAISQLVASMCKSIMRPCDTVGFLENEIVVLLLPHTELNGAMELAERIRIDFLSGQFSDGNNLNIIKPSLGVTSFMTEDFAIDDVLKRSYEALNSAMANGGGRISCFSRPTRRFSNLSHDVKNYRQNGSTIENWRSRLDRIKR